MEDLRREVIIRVRVSEAEAEALEQLGLTERMTRSEVVRLAVREAARFRGLWPPVGNKPE